MRVYDPTEGYGQLGLLAASDPVPFAGSLGFLAGTHTDSTMALLGLSLASTALSFRRISSGFEAQYRVDIQCVRDGKLLVDDSAYEAVRVASFPETQRHDESVIFQRLFSLSPGIAVVTVVVTDLYGSDSSRAELQLTVPGYGTGSAALTVVPVYQGNPRRSRAENPELVMNPRAFAAYGTDTLSFYLERYGRPGPRTATVRVFTALGAALWRGNVQLVSADTSLAAAFVHIPADQLLAGALRVEVEQSGSPVSMLGRALVGISSDWPVADFEDVLSLLRYFGSSQSRQRLRKAMPAELPSGWREFWLGTDPDSTTPDNEALRDYLVDLEVASTRFSEPGRPGWLTERGEVFLTLGRPDAIREVSGEVVSGGQRLIRWDYETDGLVLYFVSDGHHGGFRLTPTSRMDYADAVRRRDETDAD
ncbi:MAG: GWxTD domain-containing protein [Gemmatimonadota bacterium]|nr:MAG: GWxTD domain-containing protein [Gemmatimonadota bacterium]